jgi:predicted N-acyltransferase
VGHPCAAYGNIDGAVSEELMAQVFSELQKLAPVVSLKGFKPNMPAVGFVQAKGLPVAVLTLRENFWETMSSARRRNIRRKRKKASALRFEVLRGLPDPYPQIVHDLYIKVHERSRIQFERLDISYFVSTAPISQYVLAYLDGQVVGFVQTLQKDKRMVAQYIGIDASHNRSHGIYFALAIRVVDLAIELECEQLELGETHYEFKKALGCVLQETSVYFKHRNPWLHRLMSLFSFVFEPSEDELR